MTVYERVIPLATTLLGPQNELLRVFGPSTVVMSVRLGRAMYYVSISHQHFRTSEVLPEMWKNIALKPSRMTLSWGRSASHPHQRRLLSNTTFLQ